MAARFTRVPASSLAARIACRWNKIVSRADRTAVLKQKKRRRVRTWGDEVNSPGHLADPLMCSQGREVPQKRAIHHRLTRLAQPLDGPFHGPFQVGGVSTRSAPRAPVSAQGLFTNVRGSGAFIALAGA